MANKKTNPINLDYEQLAIDGQESKCDNTSIITKGSSEDAISIAFLINQLIKQQQENNELEFDDTLIY